VWDVLQNYLRVECGMFCINDKTFKRGDTLILAASGNDNLTGDTFLAEEMTKFTAGKSYSL
jgi:hypothetical protein